ncbi:DnaJ domain-containing protein [Myxozyma melibiosi]|uniref:DnaJ domain-containing protein n=1 Tax=Myxozyma melibiosi TaxID=54550 RepID=A0ABR1F7L4_9ASCO
MSSSSSSRPNETDASNRSHNQGRQSREYTPAQAESVKRVRRCRHDEFYAILDIEKTATDGEIKRAYRKLALLMHPDKNGAPGADEAFKMVSKAFQVLSDSEKKRIYDATGSDPDSRGGGMPSGFRSSSSRASAGGGRGFGGGMYGDEMTPDELFNMFFGGGGGGGGGFQTFGSFGGGPGIRVQSFGGSPFSMFDFPMGGGQRRPPPQNPPGANGERESFTPRMLIQLLPLILLFLFPLLTSLFDSGSSSESVFTPKVRFEFTPTPPYTSERLTGNYKVPYYVNPNDLTTLSDRKLRQLDQRAETSYVRVLQNKCDYEYDVRQRRLEESQGWFFVDQEKYEKARNMKMENCDRLKGMGVPYQRR